jgi:hypothetical protein
MHGSTTRLPWRLVELTDDRKKSQTRRSLTLPSGFTLVMRASLSRVIWSLPWLVHKSSQVGDTVAQLLVAMWSSSDAVTLGSSSLEQ